MLSMDSAGNVMEVVKSNVRTFCDVAVIGTCGKCGGPVVSPVIWMSSESGGRPLKYCEDCGAVPRQPEWSDWGPVIEMEG